MRIDNELLRSGKYRSPGKGRIRFRNFYIWGVGCILVTLGALENLREFLDRSSEHYKLSGMGISGTMWIAMGLIVIGLILAAYGVGPSGRWTLASGEPSMGYSVEDLEDAPLRWIHWVLLLTLAVTLIIDVMKPASLGFTLPGMTKEYGLTKPEASLLPFVALFGTTIGSFVWGRFGDLIGRRATILYSAILFVATSMCGAMPAYGWNLAMCLFMGMAAGGLLPTAIALMSELLPARYRSATVVVMAGIGALGGYLAASTAATFLEPTYGWRILWLLNLPTGLLVILLNVFIPESPRYLLSQGRWIEASLLLNVFSSGTVQERTGEVPRKAPPLVAAEGSGHGVSAMADLFRPPYSLRTVSIVLYGFAWGLVNYGFFLWLPTNLRSSGFSLQASNALLAKASLFAFPFLLLVALVYAGWSSKRTMVLVGVLMGLALLGFLPFAGAAHQHTLLITALVIVALMAAAGMSSTLSPYGAEVYPTSIRSTGSGIAAGAGKFGGLFGIAAVLAHVTPTIHTSALLVAIPVAAATVLLFAVGIETRGQRLDDVVSGEAGAPVALGI